MYQYLKIDLWKGIHVLRHGIITSEYEPVYPDPDNNQPVIVHAPTSQVIKGTSFVIDAISNLKKKYKLKFHLVHGMPRSKALSIIRSSDIFLDQFVLGIHGMVTLEAMAFGKPVVCYIKPSLISKYPADLPIINANPDNLAFVLEKLILDGKIRHETGKRSRAYVEKYHDAVKLAHELVEIYSKIIDRKRRGSTWEVFKNEYWNDT